MTKKATGIAALCLVALAPVVWQQVGQTAPALTALDYVGIEQLYARYAVGVDTGAGDGDMWAGVFTEDGIFDVTNPVSVDVVPVQGREALKAFATSGTIPRTPWHYTTNILIEPTPEGAMGVAYALAVGDAEDGQQPAVLAKAVYHDQLVKTAEGWRFEKRTGTLHRFSDELLDAWAQ